MLPEVSADPRLHENALDTEPEFLRTRVQGCQQLKCLAMPSQGTFTVSEHGKKLIASAHPSDGPELAQGDVVVPRDIGRLSSSLPHDRQAPGTSFGGLRMPVRQFRVDVQQLTGRENMPPHRGRQILGQALQLSPDVHRKRGLIKVLGHGGFIVRPRGAGFRHTLFLRLPPAALCVLSTELTLGSLELPRLTLPTRAAVFLSPA